MQIQANDIIYLILIITVIIFVVAGFLFSYVLLYNKKKEMHIIEKESLETKFSQQLLQAQIETQENTMSTLANELHDNVAQLLSSTKMLIGFTERSLEKIPETLTIANDTLGKAIDELRSLSKALNKEWLQQFNFIENLQDEMNRMNKAKTIHFSLNADTKIYLLPDKQIVLFRVVQEAIQNAVKHAKANNVTISITESSSNLFINIEDDGLGINEENINKGLGIINMKNRILLLEGIINWHNKPSKGTKVSIEIPLAKNT